MSAPPLPSHALITGGSSGIGLATGRMLAARGASVSLIARTPATLEAALAIMEHHRTNPAQRFIARAADVSVRNAVEPAVAAILAEMGPPDLLVTSAGFCRPGRIGELTAEIFEQTAAVNYLGTVYTVLACLPHMRSGSRVVLVSSGAGLVGVTGYAAYTPTKFAVRGLAEVLRADLKPRRIGVSIVYPPDTDTPQLAYEQRFKPPETRAVTGAARMLQADDVARALVDGARRGRFAITPGLEMTLLERGASLLRPLLFRHFDRLAAKALSNPPALPIQRQDTRTPS